MKTTDLSRAGIYAGVVLLLAGVQLRAVEQYVLSNGATQMLSQWLGSDPDTAEGAVQNWVVKNTPARKVIQPPRWLGWAAMSIGAVLVAHGAMRRRQKR